MPQPFFPVLRHVGNRAPYVTNKELLYTLRVIHINKKVSDISDVGSSGYERVCLTSMTDISGRDKVIGIG